jgi:N6-L-threonylcarbamoyladenine synthase
MRECWSKAQAQGISKTDIVGIAVTQGPGLAGSLVSGLSFAQGLLEGLKISCDSLQEIYLYGIHHLEAHALLPRMTHQLAFPFLTLLISGGHTQILWMKGWRDYEVMGTTRDDAVGECLDKVGRKLGFHYPSGPSIEQEALKYAQRHQIKEPLDPIFPFPMMQEIGLDMSFSGLKTAFINAIEYSESFDFLQNAISKKSWEEHWNIDLESQEQNHRGQWCYHLQNMIAKTLARHIKKALKCISERENIASINKNLVLSGGVASNHLIFKIIEEACLYEEWTCLRPDPKLCTDNGVMIAWCGWEAWLHQSLPITSLTRGMARPNWPITTISD